MYMYVVPMERAWKDDLNHTKYFKSPKLDLKGFGNKATNSLKVEILIQSVMFCQLNTKFS